MRGASKKSIAISLAAHVIVAGAIVASFYYGRGDVPGPGDVEVWISEPAGDVGIGAGAGTTARRTRSAPEESDSLSGQAVESRPVAEETAQGARGGSGGVGGPGRTSGSGGKEILSKIWRKINSSKYYPSSARRSGMTGVPKVAFELTEGGGVKWVKLVASSGKKVLDDAAVETVRRAAPLPYYPKPITVAVRYSLRN